MRRRFIVLTEDERAALFEQDPSTAGDGGFQKFLVKLQGQYRPGSQELALEEKDLEKIPRYAFDYEQGGWENMLKAIFERELGSNLGRDE